jgi:hypothetical protein
MVASLGVKMKARHLLVAALLAGCDTPTAPGPVYVGYLLLSLDGDPLPVPYGEEGTLLVANYLTFGGAERPRTGGSVNGMVRYILDVKRPGEPLEHSEIDLSYTIDGNELRINLCPPLALCFASTELIGPISDDRTRLTLTHYLAGRPGSVYRYGAVLPE